MDDAKARRQLAAVRKALGLKPDAPTADVFATLQEVVLALEETIPATTALTILEHTDPTEYHRILAHRAAAGRR